MNAVRRKEEMGEGERERGRKGGKRRQREERSEGRRGRQAGVYHS